MECSIVTELEIIEEAKKQLDHLAPNSAIEITVNYRFTAVLFQISLKDIQ